MRVRSVVLLAFFFGPLARACSLAGPAPSTTIAIIPQDRLTTWNPGIPGGVPSRTTVCANLDAPAYGNGIQDATAGIQAALDACPAGQVVALSAGTFSI